jgi:hypothetical protein
VQNHAAQLAAPTSIFSSFATKFNKGKLSSGSVWLYCVSRAQSLNRPHSVGWDVCRLKDVDAFVSTIALTSLSELRITL